MATGSVFGDQNNPKPVWQVGQPGQAGTVEMSDLVFETRGPVPGAVLVEWNIACTGPGTCGMWDVHWRIGGSAGTQLQQDICLKNPTHTTTLANTMPYQGAFLLLHVTSQANIYWRIHGAGWLITNWTWKRGTRLTYITEGKQTTLDALSRLCDARRPS